MVSEVPDQGGTVDQMGQNSATGRPQGAGPQQSMRGVSRDRWGDIYSNMPVKRLVALYDYDPQELSPNVDADQVELSFKTGDCVLVYGDMDEDGFYMGEIDGVRGLVPSNFLADADTMQSSAQNQQQRNNRGRVQGPGPGARGPPPPPRDGVMHPGGPGQRPRKGNGMMGRSGNMMGMPHQQQQGGMMQQQQQQQQPGMMPHQQQPGMMQQQQQPGMQQPGMQQPGMQQQGMQQQGMQQQGMQQQGMQQPGMQQPG
uniref:SH3 domain-containing protein n=1 Tax=Megaselia scalaris TaxID=36166 RepID=T1GBQ1_MEGSC